MPGKSDRASKNQQWTITLLLLLLSAVGCEQDQPPVSLAPLEKMGAEFVKNEQGGVIQVSIGSKATDTGLKHLKPLTKIKKLIIGSPRVTDAGLTHLQNLADLEFLDLSGTKATSAALESIKDLTSLTELHARRTHIGNEGLEHLRGLTRLKALSLSVTKISDAGLPNVGSLTTLESLDLSGTQITDAGLSHLKNLTNLQSLNLSGTRVTGAGFEQLLKLTNLRELLLGGTPSNDAGLLNLGQLTMLQTLDLTGTQITGVAMEHLTDLLQLRKLTITSTRVNDIGLSFLSSLASLKQLDLDHTQVTASGVNRLKSVLPGCTIVGRGKPVLTEGKPLETQDSHERMLTALRKIDSRTAAEHPYLGDAPRRQIAQKLSTLPAHASPSVRGQMHFQLAEAQLKAGQTQQAVKQFQVCMSILQRSENSLPNPGRLRDMIDLRLAVAYLRLAENDNCVHCRDEECCIFPLQGRGIHKNKQPARNAVNHLTELLKRNNTHITATWLLNVAYMALGEYPDHVPEQWLIPESQFTPETDFPKFTNIALKLGLNTFSLCGGMIVDDLNGDNWLDVVTSTWDTSGQMRCWLNNGNGTFTEHTEEAGLTGLFGGLNMIQADYDNDGDVDILVLRGAWLKQFGHHPNSLLQNDGHGGFRDVTYDAGLGETQYPTQSAAWADYDNDGDLDLYVANEVGDSELFNNDGAGHFTNVATNAGVTGGGYPKGVIWGDYDNDRFPDLFVSNLKGPNLLYHNNQDGTFTNVALESGVQHPERSFPTWFWDFNNDGSLDLFVGGYWSHVGHFAANYMGRSHQAGTDRLYQGDGKGGFEDVTKEMNLANVTLPMGSNFGDVDNDGFLDFYLGTGYPDYAGLMPNRMFHNQRGTRFEDVTALAGLGHLQKGHAVAFADYDHDGDQDIFIEMGGAFPGDAFSDAVFQNPGFGNHWIVIQLKGTKSNRAGIGARIRVEITEDGKTRSIYKWVNSGGTFGGSPLRQHIGLGTAENVTQLEVYWPTSDTTQVFTALEGDRMITITEGDDEIQPHDVHQTPAPENTVSAAVGR